MQTASESVVNGAVEAQPTTSVSAVVEQIQSEKQKLNKGEGNVITSYFRLGQLLVKLRGLAKKTWKKEVTALGFHPRVALRYIKLAESPLAEIGLNESDLLARLPSDLLKLEWLCRLDAAQLQALLADLDPKTAPRPKVIAAVKTILGTTETSAASTSMDFNKAVGRIIQRLLNLIERVQAETPLQDNTQSFQELLSSGLQQVQQALAQNAAPPFSPHPAGGDASKAVPANS